MGSLTSPQNAIPYRYGLSISALILFLAPLGCSTYAPSGEDGESKATSAFDVNKYPLNKTVCDPFGHEPIDNLQGGVKAELFYRGCDQPRWYTVGEYIEKGIASGQNLFFSEINVPTRLFDLGFPKETGGIVMTDDEKPLHEYFALRFQGRLRLGPEDEPGLYQLALLSDDGTILKMDLEGSLKVVVDNDGDHPTRFGCGDTIEMTADTVVPFELLYYQGPRYHISVIPMWRRIDTPMADDPQCGKLGNSMYFDYKNNSKPQQAYKDLLARGWKPWGAANYVLPSDDDHNPCYDGEAPIISEVLIDYDLDRGLIFSWNTNIPATSQVLIKNLDLGTEELTNSDNVLRTSHTVTLSGLAPGDYEFRAVSISETYGKSVSDPIQFNVR